MKLRTKLLICSTLTALPSVGWSGLDLEFLARVPADPGSSRFDIAAAEIVDYHAPTKRLFVTHDGGEDNPGVIDIIDISDPSNPALLTPILLDAYLEDAKPTSVAVNPNAARNEIAVAVRAPSLPGHVLFFDTSGVFLRDVQVGVEPDKVGYSPNGRYLVVANEAESVDKTGGPGSADDGEGSISIIDVTRPVKKFAPTVRTADFTAFNAMRDDLVAAGVRIHPDAISVAQDLEPEYFTFSTNSLTAWVTLQENNAIAEIDLLRAKVTAILPLGYKDHSLAGNGLDPSNQDNAENDDPKIANWPVFGIYQPDTIESYRAKGKTYLVTANEGDTRDNFDQARVNSLDLDPDVFPNDDIQDNDQLGRLNVSTIDGLNANGEHEALYAFGARSFSIWTTGGNLVYDSGDDFEQITAALLPGEFNSNNTANDSFDSRSDDKGPEPEGLTLGTFAGKTYAFIGLERIGGIMVYDITNPTAPSFCNYVTTRDFSGDPEDGTAGDLAPEGMLVIPANKSPNGEDLLVVAHEVSGTVGIFQINIAP